MKPLIDVVRNAAVHWVGNGFPVRTLFSYQSHAGHVSPFLLLDYAGPAAFEPSEQPRGVGEHPHRGFETVTIVYQGEIEHRDSAGNNGTIGPGDVQWMTAASGVVHEEWHERAFTRRGGVLEMVQLWVNLPAKDKMASPRYQEIRDRQIPRVGLGGESHARVIAGEFGGASGPARTFTPITVLDLRLAGGAKAEVPIPDGDTALALLLKGQATLDSTSVGRAELAVFDRPGDRIAVAAELDAELLILSGTPIDEPVVGQGPFVMNTHDEIHQAIRDYREGKMGRLSH